MSEMRAGNLGILAAIVNEPEHRERLLALSEQYRAIEQRLKEAQAQEAKNQDSLAQAQRARAEAEAISQMNAEHQARLQKFEATVGDVNNAVNDEKARWNEARQQAEAQMREREEAVLVNHKNLSEREFALKAREDAIGGREDSARAAAERAEKIIEWAKRGPDF